MSNSSLESLAYRMLGSVADAEDVVQDARLKLIAQDSPPRNESAWLFKVVTNLSIDRLRERQRRQEGYPGPWLPEPLPTGAPDEIAELAEDLSVGLLFMLERLKAPERAVFVLREGFDLPFEDIARLIDASAANCRQRYRRAKDHLGSGGRATCAEDQRAMLERLMLAVAERDLEGLARLFAEDCVVYADGGGIVSAAIRPITDPERIAQVILHLAERVAAEGGLDYRFVGLNGGLGLLMLQGGALHSTLQLEVVDGVVKRLFVVRNPHKLGHLAIPGE